MVLTRIIWSENGYKLLILANALDVVRFLCFFFTSQHFEKCSIFIFSWKKESRFQFLNAVFYKGKSKWKVSKPLMKLNAL